MSSRQLHTPAGIDRGARSGGAADKKCWARALSTRNAASWRAWTAPAAPWVAAACARRDQARRAATRLAGLRVAPLADLAWPDSVRCNPNPNLNPCPVAPVRPAAQTYRGGAGKSRLEILPLARCQKVSYWNRPGNRPTHGKLRFLDHFPAAVCARQLYVKAVIAQCFTL